MPEGVGYGEKKPGIKISMNFLTPSKRGNGKSKKMGEEEEEKELSYAELAKKRLEKKNRK